MTTNLKRFNLGLLLAALLLAALLAGLHSPLARAAGISVDTPNDSIANDGYCSLREAIINANNDNQSGSTDCAPGSGADTITFAGNYTITLTDQLTVTTEITITGNGVTNTIVQASACNPVTTSCSHDYRVFEITSNGDLTLAGLTVRHGNVSFPDKGGGIYNAGGAVTLNNCTLSGNFGNSGGGIDNEGGTVTVTDSTLSGNSAGNSGGGIFNDGGTLTVSNSTLANNTALFAHGGGIENYGGTLTVTNSTLSGNSADADGGGIDTWGGGTLTVNNSTFSDNSSGTYGGGIWTEDLATVSNSTLSGNSAVFEGGGIENGGGTLTVSNSTLSGNSAVYVGGGGIGNWWGTVIVSNSTLSGNSAEDGGGIFNNGGTVTVGNSTLTANRVETSGGGISSLGNDSTVTAITNTIVSGNIISGTVTFDDLALSGGVPITDSFTSGGHNLIGTFDLNINAFQDGANGDQTAVNNPQLGPLTDNGGDTLTHALLTGSPAIDTGDNGACPATDQRGIVRPQGVRCDIGAFEVEVFVAVYLPLIFNGGFPPVPDLVVDSLSTTGSQVTVTLRNQGNAPVVDAFWVDVYLNPTTAPSGVNQRWPDLGSQGLVWGVEGAALPLNPGQSLTLTVGDAYYWPDLSSFNTPLPVGSSVYAQVDSANALTTYGGVLESHEISGGAYNNISGPVSSLAGGAATPAADGSSSTAAGSNLPPRE